MILKVPSQAFSKVTRASAPRTPSAAALQSAHVRRLYAGVGPCRCCRPPTTGGPTVTASGGCSFKKNWHEEVADKLFQ